MKTTITTEIVGDQWVARTPHCPSLVAEAGTESQAVNRLVDQVRKHRGPWDEQAKAGGSDSQIVRQLTGVWPEQIEPSAVTPDNGKDSEDE